MADKPDQLSLWDEELPASRPRLTKATVAWLTGLYEGEGNVTIAKNGGVRIQIRMTDRDVIDRLHAIFPCIRIQIVPGQRANWKTQYAWRISKPETVRLILELMLPLLGVRRAADARKALEHLRTRPGVAWQAKKTHCAQGHEYTPENTYRHPYRNERHCRECGRVWQREYRRRKKDVA